MSEPAGRFSPIEVLNLRSHIEQHIRNAIITGVFKPNEHLIEATIAEQLGVSRSPVREALSALEREGLLVNMPRKGYHVIHFTEKDIGEIYSLRLLLEREAMRRAIERLTAPQAAVLQEIVDQIGLAAHQPKERPLLVSLDLSFHDRICQIAGHGRLYSAWNSMRMQTAMLISLTSITHTNEPDQHQEIHQRILDAMRASDFAQADALLSEHICEAEQRAHRALRARNGAREEEL
ncbi:MAG TPA: GntR family transcriptional regulator [Chloroflexaceae bacterium]|nr:GntR family transcriptional regulator [Chloroflexaceae bacterium]